MFSAEQKAALEAPLSASRVKSRAQAGRNLSYIEGWWAIAEANRIFGFDGWSRETVEFKCVAERERKVGQGDGWGVTYIAKVKVKVYGEENDISREGCGTGHGIDRDLGQAHESALKEAETDAMKRALMTFGNPFGLALYDKEQAGVEHEAPANDAPPPRPPAPARKFENDQDVIDGMNNFVSQQKVQITNCASLEDVQEWVDIRGPELLKLKKHSLPLWNELRAFKEARIQQIIKETQAA